MAKNDLLMYGLLGVGFIVFYYKFNGKQMVDNLLGGFKNNGLNLGSSSFSDKNNVNIQGDGKICINGECFEGSGMDIQRNIQSNTGKGGSIIQKQSRNQKSTVFFTIPSRFGNIR